MGENPVFNLPNSSFVREALKSLELLIVQDIFLTETAKLADVVFPALGWSEKEGTYTNLERRIQVLRKAVNSSHGMEDWRILCEVSSRMGCRMSYSGPKEIMEEIARISPLYRGLTYEEIMKGDSLWPYNGEPLRGELREIPVVSEKKQDYKAEFYLGVERLLFHSGTLSRKSPALRRISSEPVLKISPHHAKKIGLKDGDIVNISTTQGSLTIRVTIESSLEDDRVMLSNNFEGKGVFSLLNYQIDPITKVPGIEGCEVKIERVGER
jgi:predicted molibdopterin-dependent oxidoreductase YjgC